MRLSLEWPRVTVRIGAFTRRVLVCFDFAYGYPVDFAATLQAATGRSDRELPWITVWQYLSEHLTDDEGTTPGAKPSNRSNLFEVVDRINALLSPDAKKTGPFWCASEGAACQYIPQKRPPEPFQTAQGYVVKGLRFTDKRARAARRSVSLAPPVSAARA